MGTRRPEVKDFLAALHARHLKPAGFRKSAGRFARARAGYVEHVLVQGSSWNSADRPWRFYVELGVELPDHPVRSPGWGPLNASGRVKGLVPEAPDHFDLTLEGLDELVGRVARLILAASAALPERLPAVRERAAQGLATAL